MAFSSAAEVALSASATSVAPVSESRCRESLDAREPTDEPASDESAPPPPPPPADAAAPTRSGRCAGGELDGDLKLLLSGRVPEPEPEAIPQPEPEPEPSPDAGRITSRGAGRLMPEAEAIGSANAGGGGVASGDSGLCSGIDSIGGGGETEAEVAPGAGRAANVNVCQCTLFAALITADCTTITMRDETCGAQLWGVVSLRVTAVTRGETSHTITLIIIHYRSHSATPQTHRQ